MKRRLGAGAEDERRGREAGQGGMAPITFAEYLDWYCYWFHASGPESQVLPLAPCVGSNIFCFGASREIAYKGFIL